MMSSRILIFFVILLVNLHFLSAVTLTRRVRRSSHGRDRCGEVAKPSWDIQSLRNTTLNAWPRDCLESRYSSNELSERVSKSSPNVCDAAEKGDIGFVQYYAEKKGDGLLTEHQCPNNDTPLHLAAANGHLHVVRYIAARAGPSANLNDTNDKQSTPLLAAAGNGHLSVVKYLLDEKQIFQNADVSSKVELVRIAASSGNFDLLKYLVEEKDYPTSESETDQQIYLYAATGGNVDLMKYLVRCMKFNGKTSIEDDFANNPLHRAAAAGKLEMTRYLIETLHYKVDEENGYWESASYFAAVSGSVPLLKYLLDQKRADLSGINRAGYSYLHAACIHGNLEAVKYLLNEKKISIYIKDEANMNALQCAVQRGKLSVVKYLIDEEKISQFSNERAGRTLLHYAASSDNVDMIKYLLDEANMTSRINAVDGLHHTPAMTAAEDGKLAVLKYLIDVQHVNTTIVNSYGGNLLHIAARANQLEVVKYLIEEKGFDVNTKTPEGFSVYQYAEMGESEGSNNALLDYLRAKIEKLKPKTSA